MNIVLLGAPGCGKGTQSVMIEKKFGLVKITTGDLLKKKASGTDELSLKIKNIIETGGLVNDDLVNEVTKEAIIACNGDNIVFDGYPRSVAQAEFLDQVLNDFSKKIDFIIEFSVSEEKLKERISGRFTCRKCGASYHEKNVLPKVDNICDYCGSTEFYKRKEDDPNIVSERFRVYKETTFKLVEFYAERKCFYSINAEEDVEIVSQKVNKLLSAI